ncbi:MAG: hypothetical protein ACREYF_19150, partial [Gammaproteobacteria bacterium]
MLLVVTHDNSDASSGDRRSFFAKTREVFAITNLCSASHEARSPMRRVRFSDVILIEAPSCDFGLGRITLPSYTLINVNAKESLFQYGMSLNEKVGFQREMSLKRHDWVDHREHGDRHERIKAR